MKQRRTPYYWLSLAALAALMGVIFYLSAQEATDSASGSMWLTLLLRKLTGLPLTDSLVRTFAHGAEFAALGFWMLHVLNARFRALRPFAATALAWLFAWTDEAHQIFVPGRAFEFSDVATDLAGILVGAAFGTLLVLAARAVRRKRKNETK
ncbi:MAG: VanZ family protein [Clostridia bacterium]|nr:VanZ family protein [Clostridia bacterium]